jgi:superfamily II DNA or RNA helicase
MNKLLKSFDKKLSKNLPKIKSRVKSKQKSRRDVTKYKTKSSKRYKYTKKPLRDCIKRSVLPLRDSQIRVVQFMDTQPGLLVVHGTGTGKTLTAVATSQCYLDKNPNNRVVFIGPTSLLSNFKKEINAYSEDVDMSNYEFYSFTTFYNREKAGNPIDLSNALLIIDEVHNLRNPDALKTNVILSSSFDADKRLLLSATPFVNNLRDFIPLINMIYGRKVVGTKEEYEEGVVNEYLSADSLEFEDSLAIVKYYLRDKVDVVNKKDPKNFPRRVDHKVEIPMTPAYYEKYASIVQGLETLGLIFTNPNKYYNGYRRAVNQAGEGYFSAKIDKALPILKKGKSIVYTNWIEFGLKPLTKVLEQKNISYKVFTGDTKVGERQKIVNDFNNNKFDTLIITKAGGEGLDLKGVRSVVVMEPTWNDAGLQQIIGRAIRYKSHEHLPAPQRKVDVYFMIMTIPEGMDPVTTEPSGDVLLYDIINKKIQLNVAITSILEDMSIGGNKS